MGNTTVRSPFRLREGLVVLSTSPLQGNLRGSIQDIAFRRLLGEHGIVELGQDQTNSVGRKWRSALEKNYFAGLFNSGKVDVNRIRSLLDQCSELRHYEALGWKIEIEQMVNAEIKKLFL